MSKWIDVDDLRMCVNILADKMTDSGAVAIKQAINIADSLPSIEIIECKKCKYWEQKNPNSAHGWCETFNMFFTPIFFCGYGEEEDNEN